MLQHFAQHRPHPAPSGDFNEITLDTGVARVTRQPDGTLLIEGGDVDGGVEAITVAQWQNRLHVNYRAWIDENIQCFKALLSPRFCKSGENRVAWRLFNMFDDDVYMQQLAATGDGADATTTIDSALINEHPWHANTESYHPLCEKAMALGYVPAEWTDRLNAMPGPQRNESLARHQRRVEALVTRLSYAGDADAFAQCAEAAQGHAHELERALVSDIAHMKRWALAGYCDMVRRAKQTSEHLRELDEGRLVPQPQWVVLPPISSSSAPNLFINQHRSTTLTFHNASTAAWLLHGNDFCGPLLPSQVIRFDCDANGRKTHHILQ